MVKWTESSLQKLECLLAPKTKQSYLFLAPLQWPWQGCCWNLLRECNAVRHSCVPPPPYRHYRHCPPPRPFASVRFDPLAWSSGSDQRRISGCGIRWLLAGPDSLPLWLCRVCAFVLLRCFSCSHTVLPKEHSLGIIFFSSLSSCKCCIFLQFYLHFTTDYTCMIVYVTNNKEPEPEPEPEIKHWWQVKKVLNRYMGKFECEKARDGLFHWRKRYNGVWSCILDRLFIVKAHC